MASTMVGVESSSYKDGPGRDVMEAFYARFRKPLLAFFQRRAGEGDADDLTQDVFVRLARHPDARALVRPESYIFQVAANLLRDVQRKERSRHVRQHEPLEVEEGEIALPAALVEEIDPERVLQGKESAQALSSALMTLPERTRDIFLLYRFEGMRQREIARALNISLSSVEKHLTKAIAVLTKVRASHE